MVDLEKVARAICGGTEAEQNSTIGGYVGVNPLNENPEWSRYLPMARAAFASIMEQIQEHEPSDGMLEAAARAIATEHETDPDAQGPGQRHVIENNGVTTILTDWHGPLWKMWVADGKAALSAAFSTLREESNAG